MRLVRSSLQESRNPLPETPIKADPERICLQGRVWPRNPKLKSTIEEHVAKVAEASTKDLDLNCTPRSLNCKLLPKIKI